ncbi:hypothetical protein MH215_26065 [Paenibacillus sp. ACRSA]|uniref:hypothetical protein n=1 Tax=Paenibacillus sp. ACRSA TaxID=2918211 RepID=UPI001EF47554|nr:hypothetical protein [Paenibacillus sp. ACRSA]MCG7380446.1 hypothetical protein [Paenibacillus sp. ACRSA]
MIFISIFILLLCFFFTIMAWRIHKKSTNSPKWYIIAASITGVIWLITVDILFPNSGRESVSYKDIQNTGGKYKALAEAEEYMKQATVAGVISPGDIEEMAARITEYANNKYEPENKDTLLTLAESIAADDYEQVKQLYQELDGKPILEQYLARSVQFEAEGNRITDPFPLNYGMVAIDATHTGDGPFQVNLTNENGESARLFDKTGEYSGKSFVHIPTNAQFTLDVISDGAWTLHTTQKIPEDTLHAPAKTKGKGDDVVFVYIKSGTTTFTFKHKGDSRFTAYINKTVGLDSNTRLIDETGTYSGSTSLNITTDGVYAIAVQADGAWSVDIR